MPQPLGIAREITSILTTCGVCCDLEPGDQNPRLQGPDRIDAPAVLAHETDTDARDVEAAGFRYDESVRHAGPMESMWCRGP